MSCSLGSKPVWLGIIPPIASDRSKDVYNVMFLFTVLAIPVFFMVVVFGGYAAFNFTRNHSRQLEGSDLPLCGCR